MPLNNPGESIKGNEALENRNNVLRQQISDKSDELLFLNKSVVAKNYEKEQLFKENKELEEKKERLTFVIRKLETMNTQLKNEKAESEKAIEDNNNSIKKEKEKSEKTIFEANELKSDFNRRMVLVQKRESEIKVKEDIFDKKSKELEARILKIEEAIK